jgi:predicted acyltransferase
MKSGLSIDTPAITLASATGVSADAGKPVSSRLRSLDALRGFDMFWIVSGEGIFHGIAAAIKQKYSLQQNTIDWQIQVTAQLSTAEKLLAGISNQLHHSPWNGFSFYDLIFPLFIFIAGVSMPFSFGRQLENAGVDKRTCKQKIYISLLKRTLILILLGMIVNGVLQWQGYEQTRFASVLGRIALSCFFAALIYLNASFRAQMTVFILILLSYWCALILIPVPGYGAGVLTPEGNLAAYVDRVLLPGKLHRKVYDPEGLLSTIPAIASAMSGIFAGRFLRSSSVLWSPFRKAIALIIAGCFFIGIGELWHLSFPINKNMWTSSFVLYASGWSAILLGIFYLVIDVMGYKKWSMPFVWMGVNSILIYMAAHGVVDFESTAGFLFGGLINKTPVAWHSAWTWVCIAFIQFAGLYFLYRKKWFLKL